MQGSRVERRIVCHGESTHVPRRRLASAFTLIEVLVVVGLIAVLVAFLLPVLNNARDSADAVKCMSNLRSIGQAMRAYLNANEGVFAPGRNDSDWQIAGTNRQINPNENNAYWGVFYAVGGNIPREVFSCASIVQKGDVQDRYANLWCTYGLNGWGNGNSGMNDAERATFFRGSDQIALFKRAGGWGLLNPGRRVSAVRYPEKTIFCQDAWESQLDGGHNGDTYASVDAGNRGKLTEYPGHDIEYLRHQNYRVSNALFVDGHVEALSKLQQTDERYYTGRWDLQRSY